MVKLLFILILGISATVYAEPLMQMVQVSDGLDLENNENIADDYIRLRLVTPSYQKAVAIQRSIEEWLGPDMVILESSSELKIQAPRDSTKRVQFISALLALNIPE